MTNETLEEKTTKETNGSYKITCSWFKQLENYRFEKRGKSLYKTGLSKEDAEYFAKKLNKEKKLEEDITEHFIGYGKVKGTISKDYRVEYDSNTPLKKDYNLMPSVQELENFKKQKNEIKVLEYEIEIEKIKNKDVNKIKNLEERMQEIKNKSLLKPGQKICVKSSYIVYLMRQMIFQEALQLSTQLKVDL